MKVLVTGANGFLASNVIRELLSRSTEVRGMLRNSCNERSLQGLSLELVRGNIVNYSDVLTAATGCDCIIHVAADTSQYYNDPLPLFPVNVNGTLNVIKAAKELTIKRLIFVSTANTLGLESGQDQKQPESLYKKSGYALSKLIAEQHILYEVKAGHINAVIVNPAFMIGAYDAKPGSGRLILTVLTNRLVCYPKGGKNFIDVKCAATAICNAIEKGQNGRQYVLAGKNLSFGEFISLMNEVEPLRSIKIRIPSFVLIVAGIMGSLLRYIGIRSELDYHNARILTQGEDLSGKEAEDELLMPETNVKNAIKDAIEWFKKNGYLKH